MIVDKPWGKVATYSLNQPSSVRVITVEPAQETSVHYHRMRDEMWVVLDVGLTVEIGNKVVEAQTGEEFMIPAEETHRIRNTGANTWPDPRDRLRVHDRGRHPAPGGRLRASARAGLVRAGSVDSRPPPALYCLVEARARVSSMHRPVRCFVFDGGDAGSQPIRG